MKAYLGLVALSTCAIAGDWLTYRTRSAAHALGFRRNDISAGQRVQNGARLENKLKNESYSLSALTAPVVAGGISTTKGVRSVVYVAGIKGTVFALDAETGEELWNHHFKICGAAGEGQLSGHVSLS